MNEEYTCAWWNPANGHDGAMQHSLSIVGRLQPVTTPLPSDYGLCESPKRYSDRYSNVMHENQMGVKQVDRRDFFKATGQLASLAAMSNVVFAQNGPKQVLSATGPLTVHPQNPRYFSDGEGRAILLVGSHMWNNLVDMGRSDPPEAFDFAAYLDFLNRYGHNFIRLWTWDSVTWDTRANRNLGKDFVHVVAPHPWQRVGPEKALDGKLKFDLNQFDSEYFKRLRSRVDQAGRRGIYVSVMLFEGWGLMHGNRGRAAPTGWAWRGHPFHPENNINGIDAGVAGDSNSGEPHRRGNPEVTAIQSAYIRKVVDTVNDLDNVLYEVINEGGEKEWDWWVVDTLRTYERGKPKQHPIGITGHGAEDVESMLASPADWISPGSRDGYKDNPPAWSGQKVSLLDTDHIWGVGGNQAWVWKSFLRGHNPLFMDPYDGEVLGKRFDPQWEPIRRSLGFARRLSERIDLAAMTPHDVLASTQYCLADPGSEYVAYVPEGENVTLDLTNTAARFTVEWLNCAAGESRTAAPINGGKKRHFKSPYSSNAVIWLKRID